MAVHIKLIKNNIKSSSSYGKYFAKAKLHSKTLRQRLAATVDFQKVQWSA